MPNIDAAAIICEARAWVGTPYAHQHRAKGQGVDCVGLILGVGENTRALIVTAEEWAPYHAYSGTPNPRRMLEAMQRFLLPVATTVDAPIAPDGCIAWLQWRHELPMHLAITATLDGRRTMIHAYRHVGRCVEHGWDQLWLERVNSWWRYPGMEL